MTCTVKGCEAEKTEGDSLFCTYCREEWNEFCKRNGIYDKYKIEKDVYKEFLKKFQNNHKGR